MSGSRLIYADSSALVKLVLREAESAVLAAAIPIDSRLVTSGISVVEVTRAVRLANAKDDVESDANEVLGGCILVEVGGPILRSAATLVSRELRPLDAIHLATALRAEPETMLVYDRALGREAARLGLRVEAPGATS